MTPFTLKFGIKVSLIWHVFKVWAFSLYNISTVTPNYFPQAKFGNIFFALFLIFYFLLIFFPRVFSETIQKMKFKPFKYEKAFCVDVLNWCHACRCTWCTWINYAIWFKQLELSYCIHVYPCCLLNDVKLAWNHVHARVLSSDWLYQLLL